MTSSRTDSAPTYVSRDEALRHLTDNEAARVSAAESLAQLALGDEYLDLHHLDHGVRVAAANAGSIGGVLTRKSVSEGTWLKLVAQTPGQPAVATANVTEQRGRIRKAP